MKKDRERKLHYNAPLHKRRKMLNVHLSPELRSKLGLKQRAILLNKGDSVKIMRGKYKGKTAKVSRVSYSDISVYLEGITRKNSRGTEKLIPFHPSNLMVVELNITEDRKKSLGIKEIKEPEKKEEAKDEKKKDVKESEKKEIKKEKKKVKK